MGVGSNSLILSVDENPQPDLALRIVEMLRYAGFEGTVCFTLEDSERGEIGRRPVPLIEGGQIKAFMLTECLVGNNLGRIVRRTR